VSGIEAHIVTTAVTPKTILTDTTEGENYPEGMDIYETKRRTGSEAPRATIVNRTTV
jgi:hypothetical protein